MTIWKDRPRDGSGMLELARRSEIDSFIVMDVMRAAAAREAAGHRVIHMEVGQPGTPAPKLAREALRQCLDTQSLGYTLALGTTQLRERISRHYHACYGVSVSPERIVVTAGSSGAFVLAFLTLFDAGDRVLLPSPGYPCYRHILSALGCEPALMETGPETRWMPTADMITNSIQLAPSKGVLVASPNNPTGTMLEPQRLADISEACRAQNLWLISDEIYHGLTFGMAAQTALAYSDDAIVINSFSKYYSMTGWRVGWMVVPERLVRTVERLAQNFFISPSAAAQVAAMGSFDAREELEANRVAYEANRSLLLTELPKAGFDKIAPADGAFYLYCDVGHLTDDSPAFVKLMLEETGIAATPGVDFDAKRGARFVRFSYSADPEDVADAVTRLKCWSRLQGQKR